MSKSLSVSEFSKYNNDKSGFMLRPVRQEKVDEYALLMREGAWDFKRSPIMLGEWPESKEYGGAGIIDGFHRFEAARKANKVHDLQTDMTKYDNVAYALADMLKMNLGHGLPPTNGQRNNRIRQLVENNWSQSQVAKMIGLTEASISRIVKGLQGEGPSGPKKGSVKVKGKIEAYGPGQFLTVIARVIKTLTNSKALLKVRDKYFPTDAQGNEAPNLSAIKMLKQVVDDLDKVARDFAKDGGVK